MLEFIPIALCFVALLSPVVVLGLNSDGLSLLALKAAIETDPSHALDSWSESDSTPCHWHGVVCTRGRVTELFLTEKGFNGYIPSELGHLESLKRLNLANNNFSKPIPAHLFDAASLIALDLSHNSLSGPVPAQIASPQNLRHLDLSSNLLNGSLPESLSELGSLTGTLNLSYNRFSGKVPASYGKLPVIVSLDLRHNKLTGKLPQVGSLANQGPTAFAGNPSLCGFPLETPCPEAKNPSETGVDQAQKPLDPNPSLLKNAAENSKEGGASATVPLISGVSLVIGVVLVSVWLFRKKRTAREGKMGNEKKTKIKKEAAAAAYDDEEGQESKFQVMDEGFGLELENLLRASAYVVGKSRSGIVYRVVAGGEGKGSGVAPAVVAVRRLSEGDASWKFKEFEAEVEAIGKVVHPNIVRLRAYYYASDEKLLISDFIRNGSLYNALHGGPSSSLGPLPWATRLKIAQGTARGLTFVHEYSPRKYVHGNIKSTKILLNEDLQPYLSGFGLARLILGSLKLSSSASKKQNSSQSAAASFTVSASSTVYLAPEARISGSKFTQKCDVYSFGIVLMEILTGKLPDEGPENGGKGLECLVRKTFREERPLSEIIDPALLQEVYAKKQVVEAFHIALNCTELDPELRPRMKTVSDSLDHIKLQR